MSLGRYYLVILTLALAFLSMEYPVFGAILAVSAGIFNIFVFGIWLTRYIRDAIREHKMFLDEKPQKTEPYKPEHRNRLNDIYSNWSPNRFNLFDQAIEAQKKENK